MRTLFDTIELENIIDLCKKRPTVLVATPNYEERSVGFLQWFLKECDPSTIDPTRIIIHLLWPKGTSARVDLLEQLKALHFEKITEPLKQYTVDRTVFSYPNDFNDREIIDHVLRTLEYFPGEPYNLLIDISCMPRLVLVSVCHAIRQFFLSKETRQQISVYFVYASPGRYAALRYAQNVGGIKGYFSGRPIHDCRSDHLSAIVFPSLQGYEGKLLYDEVRTRISSSVTAFVAVNCNDYLTSLATMRANQFLLEQRDVNISYYFSIKDGLDKLAYLLENEASRAAERIAHSKLILVAPFGPKVFTIAACFMLWNLKDNFEGIDTEIAHVSGFQYLSLYSLGLGNMSGYKLTCED